MVGTDFSWQTVVLYLCPNLVLPTRISQDLINQKKLAFEEIRGVCICGKFPTRSVDTIHRALT